MPTLDERVAAVEINLIELSVGLRELKAGQLRAADQVRVVGVEQREAVRVEGERVTKELLAQSQQILKLATAFATFQGQVTKWAAAGTLIGAVMLFVAVRVLGLG